MNPKAKNSYPVKFCFVVAISVLVSCNVNKKLPGVYYPVHSMSPNGLFVTIKPGGKFIMYFFSDILGRDTVNGSWQVKGKRLLLTESQEKIVKTPVEDSIIKVFEKIEGSHSDIKIKLTDAQDKSAIIGADISVNNDTAHYLSDTAGMVSIIGINALRSIRVAYIPMVKIININNPRSNKITLTVSFANLPPIVRFSVPREWIIKQDKITPLSDTGVPKPMSALVKK